MRFLLVSFLTGFLLLACGCASFGSKNGFVESAEFGKLPDGRKATLFSLRNRNGMIVKVTDYGATLTELWVPGREGAMTNVVLGFDNLEQYLGGHPAFGATIGRFANRIAGARFVIDGEDVRVTPNAGRHHIHGGRVGFNRVLWRSEVDLKGGHPAVLLRYESKDGEEGYPGNLEVTVRYSLTDDNEVVIEYSAHSDKATVVNLTNHSYFNLGGGGDVLDHVLELFADRYTVADRELIPTGEIRPVQGTGLDFTRPIAIGARIKEFYPAPGGYDHNFVLNGSGNRLKMAARAEEPVSGRVMECYTTEPGVQLYTANWNDGQLKGVGGVRYGRHSGFCLETQHFPDSVNQAEFPSTVLRPGDKFLSRTVFGFSIR